MNKDTPFSQEVWKQIKTDQAYRLKLATESLYWFAHIYFPEFIRSATADFQKEIYSLLSKPEVDYLAIVAFRGSGKSTIATQIFPIWSLLGHLSKKYILILSLNQNQAQDHLRNIMRQIESNEMLLKDFGPLREDSNEWGAMSLTFPEYDARISAASMGQSIRGTRHGAYRPDLIIADDVEDTETVKTMEGRNKTHNWYVSEVLPCGDVNTKIVLIGNLLHEDSLMMRIRESIEKEEIDGEFRMYPLLGKDGKCIWPGKYPTKEAIQKERRKINNEIAWHREYLLKILPTEQQIIFPESIRRYDELPILDRQNPDNTQRYYHTFLGVDLAISQKQAADCTAMVATHVFGFQEHLRVYVDPLIVNDRLTHLQTLDKIEEVVERLGGKYKVKVIVEDVAYQRAVIEQLSNKNFQVEGFSVNAADKRSRLAVVSCLFETGKVFFPRTTSKTLVAQLTGYGVETKDDLLDALTMTLQKVISIDKPIPTFGDDEPRSHIGRRDRFHIEPPPVGWTNKIF